MSINFDISPGSASPIFKQIVDQVRLAVAIGQISEGDQLPTVRALAEKLLVNPNTVAKAYSELAREGIIDGQQGRGAFVAPRRQMYTKPERHRRISPLIDSLINEGLSLGFTPEEILESVEEKLSRLGISDNARRKHA
jgi:GntR family transcriptional regulator